MALLTSNPSIMLSNASEPIWLTCSNPDVAISSVSVDRYRFSGILGRLAALELPQSACAILHRVGTVGAEDQVTLIVNVGNVRYPKGLTISTRPASDRV